jgi:hypothetical protein
VTTFSGPTTCGSRQCYSNYLFLKIPLSTSKSVPERCGTTRLWSHGSYTKTHHAFRCLVSEERIQSPSKTEVVSSCSVQRVRERKREGSAIKPPPSCNPSHLALPADHLRQPPTPSSRCIRRLGFPRRARSSRPPPAPHGAVLQMYVCDPIVFDDA